MISIQQVRREIETILKEIPSNVDVGADEFTQRLGDAAAKLLNRLGAKRVKRSGANFELQLNTPFQSSVSSLSVYIACSVSCAVFHSANSLELSGIKGVQACKGGMYPWVNVDNLLILASANGYITITVKVSKGPISDERTIRIDPDGKPLDKP